MVIPKEILESRSIVAGQKVQIMSYQWRIDVIPLKAMNKMKEFLQDIYATVARKDDRI
jgi:hypothetical protein